MKNFDRFGLMLDSNSLYPIKTENTISVDKRLKLVLSLQNWLGCSPLTFSGHGYTVQWLSLSTARCLITALIFAFIDVLFVTNEGLGKRFLLPSGMRESFSKFERAMSREYGKDAEIVLGVVTVATVGLCLCEGVMPILNWTCSRRLKDYLNEWESLERNFLKVFPKSKSNGETSSSSWGESLTWLNVFLVAYVSAPTLASLPAFLLIIDFHPYFLYEYTFLAVFFSYHLLCQQLEDVKVVLICLELAEGMKKIRDAIKESLAKEARPSENVVYSWRQLISDVKRQNDLAGECLQGTQVAFLIFIVVVTTCFLYISLNTPLSSRTGRGMTIMALGFSALIFFRLFTKALSAERIPEEEAELANYLNLIDSTTMSDPVFRQVKATADWIASCPSTMNFGNYVTLNKRLFLGVFGQVITYLIVLMQFYQGKATQAVTNKMT